MGFPSGMNFNLLHVLYFLNRLSNTQSHLSSFSRELQSWKAISARCWSDAFINIWGFWRFCECSQVEETLGMSQSAQAVLGETSDLILAYNCNRNQQSLGLPPKLLAGQIDVWTLYLQDQNPTTFVLQLCLTVISLARGMIVLEQE